ncbi:MAG: ABC transporter permease, partial [Treponemataceae bacterium]|nr:ABC transporter permease [Treponemataceae bacterium]
MISHKGILPRKRAISIKDLFLSWGGLLLITVVVMSVASSKPSSSIKAFFITPWSSPWFVGNLLDLFSLYLLTSLGITMAFLGGTFNLGGEAQMYWGGISAAVVLLWLPSEISPFFSLLLGFLIAAGAGALLGSISGFLKHFGGADELITTFLLSLAVTPIGDYLLLGPLRDPTGNLLATPRFAPERRLPLLLPPSSFNGAFYIAIGMFGIMLFFLYRTGWGYRYRIGGASPAFSRYAGNDPTLMVIPALTISGAFHGVAGFCAVAGTSGLCHQGFPGGIGWTAITVALVGRTIPLALIPSAFLFAWLKTGSEIAQLQASLGLDAATLIQGIVLLLVTVQIRVS